MTLLADLDIELGRRARPQTRNAYRLIGRRFLKHTGKESGFTRQDVLSFLDSLDNGTINSRSYQQLGYYALKRIFKAIGEPWLLDREDLPGSVPQLAKHRPVASRDGLTKMIEAVKAHPGWYGQAYICLSSIYGLRRIEMTTLTMDLPNNRLVVKTAKRHKNEEWREHSVPDNLKPYLETYQPLAVEALNGLYYVICREAGLTPEPREGWHAIRRLLDTELIMVGGPPEISGPAWYLMVKQFLRWSMPRGDMAAYYFSPTDVDKAIFATHPFLALW